MVRRRGEHGLMTGRLHHLGDLARIGRNDDTLTHTSLGDAADDPEDERFACQWQQWLAGKTARAEPRRDHTKDGHGGTYKIRAVASSPGENRRHGVC